MCVNVLTVTKLGGEVDMYIHHTSGEDNVLAAPFSLPKATVPDDAKELIVHVEELFFSIPFFSVISSTPQLIF